jgi:hypothetical protein
VTIQAGATLAPGTSAGTLTVGSATLHGTLRAEFGNAGTDLLHCTGALTLGATASLLLEPLGPPPTAKVIPLARYSPLTGTFANVSGLPEGYELVYAKTIGEELFIALVSTVTEDPYLVWIGALPTPPRGRAAGRLCPQLRMVHRPCHLDSLGCGSGRNHRHPRAHRPG